MGSCTRGSLADRSGTHCRREIAGGCFKISRVPIVGQSGYNAAMISNSATDHCIPQNAQPDRECSFTRYLGLAGMLCCIVAGGLLGFRTIVSPDTGYHLAYGEKFLQTGRPVDSSPELYTVPAHATPEQQKQDPPGPGCWYDDQGQYRFPNANWLSQVIFAIVHRAGGMRGLSILGGLIVLGLFTVSAVTMRKLGISAIWTGAGLLLIAMTAYERFNLRPELLGYFILACELCLLLPNSLNGQGLNWRKISAMAILQLLLVNLHSYWLLGLGITIAVLAAPLLRLAWLRFVSNVDWRNSNPDLIRRAKFLAILLGIQILLAFVNPWTWQLVLMPFQTLIFFRQNHITTILSGPAAHPWSIIAEFFPPFYNGLDSFTGMAATYSLYMTLVLAVVGLIASAILRRWAMTLLLLGFLAVSLQMRRNIAPGAIIMIPVALAGIGIFIKRLVGRFTFLKTPIWPVAGSALVLILAAGLICLVVTQRFYFNERRPERFGLGASQVALPLAASAWLSEHRPKGNIWTDYNASSNFYYFTEPHPALPIITNTWAYPPRVMKEVLDTTRGLEPFRKLELQYDIQIIAISINSFTAAHRTNDKPLVQQLLERRDWSLVHIDARHGVFLRNNGINAELAKACEIKAWQFDVPAFIAKLKTQDPVPAYSLQCAAATLQRLRWYNQSIEISRAALKEAPRYHQAWFEMGASYALQAQINLQQGLSNQARENFENARTCFQNCLKIKPDYKYAKKNLTAVNIDLQRFER